MFIGHDYSLLWIEPGQNYVYTANRKDNTGTYETIVFDENTFSTFKEYKGPDRLSVVPKYPLVVS